MSGFVRVVTPDVVCCEMLAVPRRDFFRCHARFPAVDLSQNLFGQTVLIENGQDRAEHGVALRQVDLGNGVEY